MKARHYTSHVFVVIYQLFNIYVNFRMLMQKPKTKKEIHHLLKHVSEIIYQLSNIYMKFRKSAHKEHIEAHVENQENIQKVLELISEKNKPLFFFFIDKLSYKVVDFVNWIKTSKYGRYRPSNGYFLQHDKETCLVGVNGTPIDGEDIDVFRGTIVEERGARQSHKPPSLQDIIERMFPGGLFLEIFARAHNQREGWVSIGLEVPD